MKKLLCGILAGTVLALSFAGCGTSDSDSTKDTSSSGVTGEITVVSREDGSGTRSAFTELLGIIDDQENDATTETAEITNSTSVMITTVEGNKNAIGYVSLGSLSDTVKEVKVDGVEGNAENVKNGTYKISRPFNLAYYDGKLSKVAQDFVDFIMSSDGQQIVDKEGYISVEEGEAYKSAGLSGKVTLAGSTSVAPLMNVIADEYKKLNPDVSVEIQESGSSAGIQSAMQKAVDIG
ncbi:MAG: substrate-binding domain-containing protein, partial [Ruminococcus sp.]